MTKAVIFDMLKLQTQSQSKLFLSSNMKKLASILLILCSNYWVHSQVCGTPHPTNPTIYSGSAASGRTLRNTEFCIDVFFHIVRNTNGTNTFILPNTDAIVKELNKFLIPKTFIVRKMFAL